MTDFAPGALLDGKLRVIRQLGAGGMGAVYEVEHLVTKHRRALKLLHPELTLRPAIVARFLREASAAGRIGNPHIVETHDAGTLSSGEPYLLMDLLDGRSLGDEVARGPLAVPRLVAIVRQACEAIQAAHDAGIVHRDLKPDNLFVGERDGAPFVTVLDFGISKFDEALTGGMGVTTEGAALGTPYYMSPEQVSGQPVDGRSDVYALGIILYEAATGKRPFEADTLPHLSVLIHEGKPIPAEALRPDLPAALCEVIARAMAPDRERRFQTARALAGALSGAIDAGPAGDTEPRPAARGLALDRTEVAPATPVAPGASAPVDASPAAPSPHLGTTAAPLSTSQHDPSSSKKSPWLLASIVAGAVAIGAVATTTIRRDPTPPVASPAQAARVPEAEARPSTSAPSVTPVTPVTPVTSASAQASAAPMANAVPALSIPPGSARGGSPAAPSRTPSKQPDPAGLARENPYR